MTQEDKRYLQEKISLQRDKELLLKDLCGRLPYGVKVLVDNKHWCDFDGHTPSKITFDNSYRLILLGTDLGYVKPYLFPISYIDDNEKLFAEYITTLTYDSNTHSAVPTIKTFDFYNKYHIDYRGLIERGLAIDATKLNIY